jgi:hypothetical protein
LCLFWEEIINSAIKIGVRGFTRTESPSSHTHLQVHQGTGDITENKVIRNDNTYVTAGFNTSIAVNQITRNLGVGPITLETV